MRVSEARAIGAALAKLPADSIAPCLNVGSSTGEFRTVAQPHIDRFIFAALRDRGVRVIHADIKAAPGVDLVGDVYDPAFKAEVTAIGPRLVICSNLLEHLEDRDGFMDFCRDVLAPGGHMLLTVPCSYPYHLDPIDTGYRPTPAELEALFPGYAVEWSEEVADSTYWDELKVQNAGQWGRFVASLAKAPWLAIANRPRFLSRYHRLLWLFRRYSVSCVLVRKPG
jgi:SAM-dependent methyltransferase